MGIEGWKTHTNRLRGLAGGRMERDVGRALFAGGEAIQVEAQTSITNGAVSGAGHVASAPGEAPNNDTGVLAGNIETTQVGPFKVRVTSSAPYASDLEFDAGGDNARPYMRPARDAKEHVANELVTKAINANIKKRK